MPSASVLEQKQKIVKDLAEQVKNSVSGVLVNYNGISVEDDTELRKSLRDAGVKYEVVKNTLLTRIFEEAGYEELKNVLSGMTALATCDNDPIAPAKILYNYAKNSETFKIKAGFADGKALDAKGVETLASIPSREVLVGKMLGSMQSSLYSFAYVLQAIIDKNGGEASA